MTLRSESLDFSELWSRPGYLVRRLHQIHVAIFLEECSEFNLTPVQFGVLTVLYEGEALEQSTIAKQIGIIEILLQMLSVGWSAVACWHVRQVSRIGALNWRRLPLKGKIWLMRSNP